jgi:molybdenum ABC transporter molybdate-binding protein
VYCAAGLKAPVEAIASQYETSYGAPIQIQYGGSHTLLTSIEVSRRGDLYLPGDNSYIRLAQARGLVAETISLARMTAVLAVKKGNPKQVRSLADLSRPGVSIAQANPDAAAVGKLAREALQRAGHWEALLARTVVFKPTVSDVANDIKLGTVDAGFVWDALARQYPELEIIPAPELTNSQAHIAVGVMRHSEQPSAALRFARFLSARDKGLPVWQTKGYEIVAGDLWAEQPELRLYAGAMLRPAVEATIGAFERREGVRVTRVYNGCGILVAQMLAGERPDAYFACDRSFMFQVRDLFLDAEDVSQNQLVILAPRGNPRQIKALSDLAAPGLRVGVGHEKQSALGVLTKAVLLTNGVYEAVMQNVAVQSPTGDFLVNQLRTGSLDAVVAYRSNGAGLRDVLETIPINSPGALAIQPVALGRQSNYPQLATRLIEALKSRQSKARFESAGFKWEWQRQNSSNQAGR